MKQITSTIIIYFIFMVNANAQKIKISTGAASFVATAYDNSAATAFIALLPMTIGMNELNGNEKYHFLSQSLPLSPEYPSTIQAGDIMLYGTNCIVLFYETFTTSYGYTKIGLIDNPIGLKAALGSNNATVTFELLNSTEIGTEEQNHVEFSITNEGVLQYNSIAKRISLVDMNGRTLLISTSNALNIAGFSKGVYILVVEEHNQRKTIKIMI